MGVRKSGRRPIEVLGRTFVWYVCEDSDSCDLVLHVSSEDKAFLVNYHLSQPDEPYLIVLGRDFPGVPDVGGVWRRFRCARWEDDGVVTPAVVRRLVEWCLSSDKELVEIGWRNSPLHSG
jgi:hypothetical protein